MIFLLGWLSLVGTAHAQQEACGDFPESDLVALLDRADAAMVDFKLPVAWRILEETRKDLRCLDTLIRPRDLGRLAHGYAFLAYLDQDEHMAGRWITLAASLIPEITLPIEPPPMYRSFWEEREEPWVGGEEDLVVAKLKGGVVPFLDARLLRRPITTGSAAHFVQLVDRKGQVDEAWWQDGTRFDERLVADKGRKKPPKWAVAMSPPPPAGVEAPAIADAEGPPPSEAPPPEPEPAPKPPPPPEPLVSAPPPQARVPAPEPEAPSKAPAPEPATADEPEREEGWISQADEREWMPDCPWAGQEVQATAIDDVVTVNGQSWQVGYSSGEAEFVGVLQDCHAYRAVRRFQQWRKAKRQVRIQTGTTGGLDTLIRVVGETGQAIAAEVHRKQLERLLEKPRD